METRFFKLTIGPINQLFLMQRHRGGGKERHGGTRRDNEEQTHIKKDGPPICLNQLSTYTVSGSSLGRNKSTMILNPGVKIHVVYTILH